MKVFFRIRLEQPEYSMGLRKVIYYLTSAGEGVSDKKMLAMFAKRKGLKLTHIFIEKDTSQVRGYYPGPGYKEFNEELAIHINRLGETISIDGVPAHPI